MTDSDWLFSVLSDGKPHTHAEIMRRSIDERGHGLTPHSRAADLRKLGHQVDVQTWRANGRVHSTYRLVSRVEPQVPLPSSSDRGSAACGSTGQTAPSTQPTSHPGPGGVGYVDGDGQLALLEPVQRGAYSEAA